MKYDFTFYLGTHQPNWLWNGGALGPMFVAAHRMKRKSAFPASTVPFALDSGGYNHLLREGVWTTSPREYAEHAQRIMVETGKMEWAAVQDWVCAPDVLAKTGKTVLEHQQLTLENYFELQHLAPRVKWVPMLQGSSRDDYLRHVEMHEEAGVVLEELDTVGIGSVAPRQSDDMVVKLLEELHGRGINLHGFGIKLEGLRKNLPFLKSSDSMAWSWHARKNGGDRNGQPDAEKYRKMVADQVTKMEEYVAYEGILEFFPTGDDA